MVLLVIPVFAVVVRCLQCLRRLVQRLGRVRTYRRVPPSHLLWALLEFLNTKSNLDCRTVRIHRFVDVAPLWATLWFLSGSEG